MPIYEFECRQCGTGFERLQKLSDPDPEQCPSCGVAGGIRRRISAPSFRLAGSGWYETDFKSNKDARRNLAGNDGGGDSSSGTASSHGGDSKPAAGGSAGTSSAAPTTTPTPSSSSGTT